MKNFIQTVVGFSLLLTYAWLGPETAMAKDTPTEISVESVFIPAHGYDDNDHIVMVLAGELPHLCYTLADTRIETRDHVIRVHQYAWLRRTGICGTGDADPDLTAPYETEVSLGQLDAGDYEIQFLKDSESHTVGSRRFNVAVAEGSDIDNFTYAAISDVMSQNIFFDNEPVRVAIQGSTNFSCEQLAEDIRVEKQDDVFVVMPIIVEQDRSVPCRRERHEFRREIDLGKLRAGKYLVHVRSMSGKAMNRILNVYPKL